MLKGKIAWITGATGGLGPAVVAELAAAGAAIVATGLADAEVAALRDRIGVPQSRWLGLAVDLADAGAVQAAAERALGQYGRIDILVAGAGGWRGGATAAETTPETLDFLLRINLLTAFNACRAVLPAMVAQGWGRIITFGARSAVGGQSRSAAYAASKAALVALTQSIAAETRQAGVTANAILISTLDTPANRAAMPDADPGRWVSPEQIAAAVRFLCGDEAGAISGAAIPIYGRA